MMHSDSGYANSFNEWIGKYSNQQFDYFARHQSGPTVAYDFNSQGWRGPEPESDPDICVFGSSFSFGVGVEYHQCWHQLLGDYRVNCYAPAGFLVTNNDIINHYHTFNFNKQVLSIIQLREFRYNVGEVIIPPNARCFVVDEIEHPAFLNLPWSSFVDKAHDGVHPGPKTHQSWAKILKKMFNL